ncbi:nuclear pore complex protein Nup133 isoform X2 [Aethina tumida]|uniref:nuclear pore complex protein Nup133 isoform X2 n=1 Tax=Aethina tumida TaxID=116153 RepID=UPI00214956BB|nr:nuclear pore complex protein Nup133 isoform X2 [Aethina tumida]
MEQNDLSPFSPRSPFTSRSRQNVTSKRLMPVNFRKSSRFSVSGKSTQSLQIILKSSQNYVERFGQPLPVLITEALTFADRSAVVSARISECGYVWVVCGRRLLIWQYRQTAENPGTPTKRNLMTQCFELQLPQSDLAHRAELVSVFLPHGHNIPACIAVSPEGVVRYWPAIAHDGVTVEKSIDLQGQECDSLTEVEGLGCILATTTCTIVLVQPTSVGGRHSLENKPLGTPNGWLGGISKRMSSLIFGPISTEQSTEPRLVRVLSVTNKEDNTWTVYVLAGHSLQKWSLSDRDTENLVFYAELNRLVRDSFHNAVWDNCIGDQTDIDTWLLDIQPDNDGILILAAAVNMQMSPQVHYAMISIATAGTQAPTSIRNFMLLKISSMYNEDNPGDALLYRFLYCGNQVYLYNQKSITVVKQQQDPDVLEFNSPKDFLLGGSICVNTPVFFSRNSGLVSVSSNEFNCDLLNVSQNVSLLAVADTSSNESVGITNNNLSVYNMDPEELYEAYKDSLSQLKAAFIFYVQNQQGACEEILSVLYPIETTSTPTIDSLLDKTVIKICNDLLDDIPAKDPRWTDNATLGIGSSYYMQILPQLEDKQKAFSLFLRFLKDTGLWQRLAACSIRDTVMPTIQILAELSEKIIAAIILKSLPVSLILENAIENAIKDSDIERDNGLTNQDIFYREVSKVEKCIQELANLSEDVAHSNLNPEEIVQHIYDSNEIILTVLNEVIQYRLQRADTFALNEVGKSLQTEYIPWTAASDSEGLMDALLLQHSLTFTYGMKLSSSSQLKSDLVEQFVALTDLILDGRKSYLESIRGTDREAAIYKQYCTDRHKLIKPLLQDNEYEKAAQLAEKYLDFETLVIICDNTDNNQRLDEYIDRFRQDGFAEYMYNWFFKENKQGKLIDRYRQVGKSDNLQTLTKFLSDHPSLSWMQHIFDKKFAVGADTLNNLASTEVDSLDKYKTLLSMSKLAKLAGPNTADVDKYVDAINNKLKLVGYQKNLPGYVLQGHGFDVINPGVISAKDIINLYISSEYTDATEVEFRSALEMLKYITDYELRQELNVKIWCNAILRDTWDYKNLNEPMAVLQSTLFFKIIELCLALGADPSNLLPPLDLLTDGLTKLEDNTNFQFLIKTAYDHLDHVQVVDN